MKNLLKLGKVLIKDELKAISGGCPQGFYCACGQLNLICTQFFSNGTDCFSNVQDYGKCEGTKCSWL